MVASSRKIRLPKTSVLPSEKPNFSQSLSLQRRRDIRKRVESGEFGATFDSQTAKVLKDAVAKSVPTHDTELPDFDVIVPYELPPPGQTAKKWEQIKQNFLNEVKNATSLFVMMRVNNGIPDFDPGEGFRASLRYPRYLLSTRSVAPDSPLSTLRQQCLDSYITLFSATFQQNTHKASDYTSGSYRTLIQQQIDRLRNNNTQAFWEFRREVTPPRILSIRTTVNPFAGAMSNPNVTQLVVKFDTLQTLERYSKDGRPLHQIAKSHPLHDPAKLEVELKKPPKDRQRIPAEPQRIIEYLVMEKKWWMYPQWRVRSAIVVRDGQLVKEERWKPFGASRRFVGAVRDAVAEEGFLGATGMALKAMSRPSTYVLMGQGIRDLALNTKDRTVLSWYALKWAWTTGRTLPWKTWYREIRTNTNPRYLEQLKEKQERRRRRLENIPGWKWFQTRREPRK